MVSGLPGKSLKRSWSHLPGVFTADKLWSWLQTYVLLMRGQTRDDCAKCSGLHSSSSFYQKYVVVGPQCRACQNPLLQATFVHFLGFLQQLAQLLSVFPNLECYLTPELLQLFMVKDQLSYFLFLSHHGPVFLRKTRTTTWKTSSLVQSRSCDWIWQT